MTDMTATETDVHQELLLAARAVDENFYVKEGESEQGYLRRMLQLISEVSEADFESMSDEAQTWYNEAVETFNVGKRISSPPGLRMPRRAQLTRPLSTPRPRKSQQKRDLMSRGRTIDSRSIGTVVRRALIADQSLTPEEIRGHLEREGLNDYKLSTLMTTIADTLKTLRIAAQMGKFEPNPPIGHFANSSD